MLCTKSKMISGFLSSSPSTVSIFLPSPIWTTHSHARSCHGPHPSPQQSAPVRPRYRQRIVQTKNWKSWSMRGGFVRKTLRRELGMTDSDSFEIPRAPQIAVHADGEGRNWQFRASYCRLRYRSSKLTGNTNPANYRANSNPSHPGPSIVFRPCRCLPFEQTTATGSLSQIRPESGSATLQSSARLLPIFRVFTSPA